MQILATGHNPNDYGFKIKDDDYSKIKDCLDGIDFNDRAFWRMIQDEFKKNYDLWKDDKKVNWIFEMDFKG